MLFAIRHFSGILPKNAPHGYPSRGVPFFINGHIDKSKTFGGFEKNTQTPNSMLKIKYFPEERRQLGDFLRRCFFGRQYFDVSFPAAIPISFLPRIFLIFSVCSASHSERNVGIFRITGTRSVFAVYNAVLVILYFVFWFFSKKKVGWLIAGTVFFALDTAFVVLFGMISGDFVSLLVDILFHILALVEMILGVTAAIKLKKLPDNAAAAAEISSEQAAAESITTKDQPGISDEFKN